MYIVISSTDGKNCSREFVDIPAAGDTILLEQSYEFKVVDVLMRADGSILLANSNYILILKQFN